MTTRNTFRDQNDYYLYNQQGLILTKMLDFHYDISKFEFDNQAIISNLLMSFTK